jgi:hypothetical protein
MRTFNTPKIGGNQVNPMSKGDLMHIQFERSGGLMGTTTKSSFDLSDLQEDDATQIRTIVEQINFSTLPKDLSVAKNAPDQFTYKISIQTQEWEHTIITSDGSAPLDIQPLIKILSEISRLKRAGN